MRRALAFTIEFDGGVEWDFPFALPQLGDRTQSIKVLGVRALDAKTVVASLEGLDSVGTLAKMASAP